LYFSRHKLVFFLLTFFTLCAISSGFAAAADINSSTTSQTQIPFIENQGQYPSDIEYYSSGFHGSTWVTNQSIGYGTSIDEENRSLVILESFMDENGNTLPLNPQNGEISPTKVSYFLGSDSSKWKSDIASYKNININYIYPGISLSLENKGGLVEKIFHIAPYTNPDQIIINLQGAEQLYVDSQGQLKIINSPFNLTQSKPVAYQIINGQKTMVDVSYRVNGFTYGFILGNYNPQYDLFIDPVINSTYIGGSANEKPYSMELDSAGNIYITGQTFSSDYPTTPGAYDTTFNGNDDIMVSKFDPTLSTLLASTFIGSPGGEIGYDIAIDNDGNVFVTGYTSINFPTTPGAYDTTFNGVWDVFVSKFNNNLTVLLASTYLGSYNGDFGSSVVIDDAGNVYVGGWTYSTTFPTTPGAFDTSFGGDADGFISKFDNTLSSLLNSTFIGGNSYDPVTSLKIMSGTKILIGGVTQSTNFPVTPGAYQPNHAPQSDWPNGWRDGYISIMNLSLSSLNASTYLGGSAEDWLLSADYDSDGNIFVSGYTYSGDFPTTIGSYDQTINGDSDIFVSKLNQTLTSLLASTFLGGNGEEVAYLDLDDRGKVILGGSTSSSNFPLTPDAYINTRSGPNDAILARMSLDLSVLLFSTLWGGNDVDYGSDVMSDSNGSIILLGTTSSTNFPTNPEAYDKLLNGNLDGFVTKFTSRVSLHVNKYASTYRPTYLSNVTFYVAVTNNGPDNATGVMVQDLIPAGLSVINISPSQGSYNQTTGIWNIGRINPGNTVVLQVLSQVMVHNTTLTNTALLYDLEQWGTDPLVNSTTIPFFIPPEADLAVTKSVNNSTPHYLDPVTFTITVTNNGPDGTHNVKVSDLLPAGLSYLSTVLISQGSYNTTSGLWTVGTLSSGASATLQISALVNASNRTITNVANASSDSSDVNLSNNVATVDVNVPPAADLFIAKSAHPPESLNYGDTLAFWIDVTNLGPDDATNVQFTEILPAGLEIIGYYTYGIGTFNTTTGVRYIGTLPAYATAIFDLYVKIVGHNVTLTNNVTVTGNEYDYNLSNNNNSTTITIPPAIDLKLLKSFESYHAPSPTETANYLDYVNVYLHVTNEGPDNATGVQVSDLLPGGLEFISVQDSSQGTFNPLTGIWDVGILNNGDSAWIMITCLVNASNTTIYNTANTSANQYDWNMSNNNASAQINVHPAADISVKKTVSKNNPMVCENFTWTILVKNNGPDTASGVVVNDILPAGLNLVSFTPSQGTYNPATGIWNVGTLINGANATLSIVTNVSEALNGATITNNATKTSASQYDWNTSNDASSATVTIPANKNFTLTVKNNGSGRIHGIYYVTMYKPCGAAPIFKKYDFYLNPGQSVTFNIGNYPVGTAISTDELVYNTASTKKTVNLTNTWTVSGLTPYVQNYLVYNVPAYQAKAALARKRFGIYPNTLTVVVVRAPALL